MLLARLHNALAAWACALVLGCNGSGNTGVVSLCHLLATHVITCVWPAAIHPRTGALASRQALITPGTCGVDCTVPHGPISRQYGPVRLRPALSVHLLRISPIRPTPSCCLRVLVFFILYDLTSLLICPLASPPQRLGSSRYSIPTQHSFPLTRQSTRASIALSILCRTAFLADLRVN